MNARERHAISRVYNALGAVSFPASGSQSTSVRGLAEFAADMRKVLPASLTVLVTLCGESYRGELDDDIKSLECAVRETEKRQQAKE